MMGPLTVCAETTGTQEQPSALAAPVTEGPELPQGVPTPVPEAGERIAVIPPGYEEMLSEMVGRGVSLPGGCTMTRGEITGPAIHATYKCSTGEVVLEIVHPDRAPRGATLTEHFAIAVQGGSAPDGLVAEVANRARAREKTFEWKWLGTNVKASGSQRTLVIAGASLLGVALAVWALTMRVKSRRS